MRLGRILKNSADQGGCYPERPKAEVDNAFRDLQNSSYPTKAEFYPISSVERCVITISGLFIF